MKIYIFTGYAGAGKTTLAKKLARYYHLEFIEHQKMVHGLAERRGFKRARYWLANVGRQRFVEESEQEMISLITKVGKKGESGVVVDVSYGIEMINSIKRIFPSAKLCVIYVALEVDRRNKRIMERMSVKTIKEARKERRFRDGFLEGVGVRSVIKSANVNIVNSGSIKETFTKLIKELEKRREGV